MAKKNLAYLLIAHGTRDSEGSESFFKFVEEFRKSFRDRMIEPAFLEICRPSIKEGIDACVKKGAEEIFIIPLMLFPGRHVKEDIPREIQEAKHHFPQVDFHYAGPLALTLKKGDGFSEPKMFDLLLEKITHLQS